MLLLKNGKILENGVLVERDILVDDKKIVKISENIEESGAKVFKSSSTWWIHYSNANAKLKSSTG